MYKFSDEAYLAQFRAGMRLNKHMCKKVLLWQILDLCPTAVGYTNQSNAIALRSKKRFAYSRELFICTNYVYKLILNPAFTFTP